MGTWFMGMISDRIETNPTEDLLQTRRTRWRRPPQNGVLLAGCRWRPLYGGPRPLFADLRPIGPSGELDVALDEYKRKRDFSKSPEPRARAHEKRRWTASPFFCVQKHLTSHLHYDFRLEHNGVLLSWAVPKGPSLDPSVKRLAMRRGSPDRYGEFEGRHSLWATVRAS